MISVIFVLVGDWFHVNMLHGDNYISILMQVLTSSQSHVNATLNPHLNANHYYGRDNVGTPN
jgi:hypothetical protein